MTRYFTKMTNKCLLAACFVLSSPLQAESLDPTEVMQALRAQGENAFSAETIANFDGPFKSIDADSDGLITAEEYVTQSRHFRGNEAGALGFIRVSDNNGDGKLSFQEYLKNRIITDEAKEIYDHIDPTTDLKNAPIPQWKLDRKTFVEGGYFTDEELAGKLFDHMNVNNDDSLTLPEYLAAYGPLARQGLPAEILDGVK